MTYDSTIPVTPGPSGRLKVSPTDVSQFIRLEQCGRYLRLRLHERSAGRGFMEDYGVWPQSIPPLLNRSGGEFEVKTEAAITERFPTLNLAGEAGDSASRPPNNARVVELAQALPPGEKLFLFQVRLVVELGRWSVRGDADILRMERDGDGHLHLLIADMKSSAAAKVEHRLQVAFYHAMLEELLKQARVDYVEIAPAILYRGPANSAGNGDVGAVREPPLQEEQRAAATELFGTPDALLEMVPDPDAYLESVRDLVTGDSSLAAQIISAPFEDLPYHLTYKCDGCIYNEFCMKWSAERDDLSLIPHLTTLEKDALRRAGVKTVREVAGLKDLRQPDGRKGAPGVELVPAAGKEALVKKLASTWPVGPRIDELVYRARYYRSRWKKDQIDAVAYLPGKGHGSLPYCDPRHNPNLVRVYVDAQHDYLQDRLYMLGALVVASEAGEERPERRRGIVRMTDGPPDTPEKERELLTLWIDDTLRAVVELAAPDENGERNAPVHLIFFNRYEQRVLLDALGRHLPNILGATPLYDFMTQVAAFDSPIVTFLDEEIRELKNYPMVCQSLQSVAAFLKFDWNRGANYREIFKERLFDFWGRLDDAANPQGESPWYTNRARFKSDIPLEYAYTAWDAPGAISEPFASLKGKLRDAAPSSAAWDGDAVGARHASPSSAGELAELAPYRGATLDLLSRFEALRLEAIEHVARDFEGNRLTQKSAFSLPDLSHFSDKAPSLARALQEFVTIERHVELAAWKSVRNLAPERRVLMGETLLARYLEANQDPEAAEANREAARRALLKEQYEEAYMRATPRAVGAVREPPLPTNATSGAVGAVREPPLLTKEQKKETAWSLEGRRFLLRLETQGVDAGLEEVLALSALGEGDRVVLFPRMAVDKRLPPDQRTDNTPTPKQMLYGARADIRHVVVERDEGGNPTSALIEVEMARDSGATQKGFLFSSFGRQPLVDGALYTLDPDPTDYYGYWCSVVADGLCRLEEAGESRLNTLYDRIAYPSDAPLDLSREAVEAQARFLEGLRALDDFEPSKRDYIGGHAADQVLLVQGPPGTGKSYSTAFAILARMQGALAAGQEFRVLVSCKTHAATDVLIENVRGAQARLRTLSETHPAHFARHFDARMLDAPLFRVAPRRHHEGITGLPKDGDKDKSEARNADIIASHPWCVSAATPGGVYGMVKERWSSKDLFGHHFANCLVLDEASQMNLPEAAMAALPLDPGGQIIVVGDPRQMPPIVKHDWSSERRRTFQEYKSYQSLFDTLLESRPAPPMIKFAESFRLHADMAEFLRREIYSKDGIPFHSNKRKSLNPVGAPLAAPSPATPASRAAPDDHRPRARHAAPLQDPFVAAVLDPNHPIVVVVHDEAQSQARNPFERELIAPVLEALVDPGLYALDATDGLGVVVPHRAQRADLQSAFPFLTVLDEHTGSVRYSAVDTVERFQGGERTAILVGATESDRDYLLASSNFLYDPRRLTVAISRAKEKMVLVASRSVFSLFSPEEEAFANAQLWKNLLRRTCTVRLWEGERGGKHVEVWGNQPVL